MMRDLLYLSENKMRALVPQLPGKLRRRLGFEAGLNAGVVSAKATLPSESQPSPVALLDAVVEMIEREKGSRWRTDSDLRTGDWIQFEEEFHYGDATTAPYLRSDQGSRHALSGLVYFAAADEPPFVLCGSAVHVLDRWQPGDLWDKWGGQFYTDALGAYARKLAEMRDEAATTEFVPPAGGIELPLAHALRVLCGDSYPWTIEPVRLCGHARVLAVVPGILGEIPRHTGYEGPPFVLATPLYVEYAHHE